MSPGMLKCRTARGCAARRSRRSRKKALPVTPSPRKLTAVPEIWSARRWIAKNAWMSASSRAGEHRDEEPDHPRAGLLGDEDAAEGAHEHHPLEADVDDAGALGEHAADRRERERRRRTGASPRAGSTRRRRSRLPMLERVATTPPPIPKMPGGDRAAAGAADACASTTQPPSAIATAPTRTGHTVVRASTGGSATQTRQAEADRRPAATRRRAAAH